MTSPAALRLGCALAIALVVPILELPASWCLQTVGWVPPGFGSAAAALGESRSGSLPAPEPAGRIMVAREWAPWLDEQPRRRSRPRRAVRSRSTPKKPAPATAVPAPKRSVEEPQELIAIGLAIADFDAVLGAGFRILDDRPLVLVPGVAIRVRPPRGQSLDEAQARLQAIAPRAVIDRNHLYGQSYRSEAGDSFGGELTRPYALLDWPRDGRCGASGPIGMIDTRIDPKHPALHGRAIDQETIRGAGYRPSSTDHGTAVAALIVGGGALEGASPGAQLVAVDAFHRRGGRDAADAFDLAAALDRLATRGVGVVNLSFSGPRNAVLDRIGQAAAERGTILVAASGNNGSEAAPEFPAAHDWAVAVTAVDQDRQVGEEAVRGSHIAFAAPGVRLLTVDRRGRPVVRSGTSFAAPLVTAAIATAKEAGGLDQFESVARLAAGALDLGEPGRDPVFGWGLPQLGLLCSGGRP